MNENTNPKQIKAETNWVLEALREADFSTLRELADFLENHGARIRAISKNPTKLSDDCGKEDVCKKP